MPIAKRKPSCDWTWTPQKQVSAEFVCEIYNAFHGWLSPGEQRERFHNYIQGTWLPNPPNDEAYPSADALQRVKRSKTFK